MDKLKEYGTNAILFAVTMWCLVGCCILLVGAFLFIDWLKVALLSVVQ